MPKLENPENVRILSLLGCKYSPGTDLRVSFSFLLVLLISALHPEKSSWTEVSRIHWPFGRSYLQSAPNH